MRRRLKGKSLCAAPAEDALDAMDVRATGQLPRVPHNDERHRPETVTLIAGWRAALRIDGSDSSDYSASGGVRERPKRITPA